MSKNYRKALWEGKCPSCREGSIFKYPLSFSHLRRFAEMHKECPVCSATFEPEPGFYFGSMFITYAFNVIIVVMAGVGIYYFWSLPEWAFLLMVLALATITMPLSFRLSRVLWLWWFGGLQQRPPGAT